MSRPALEDRDDGLGTDTAANLRHDKHYGFNPKGDRAYSRRPCPPYWEFPPDLLDDCETDEQARLMIWRHYSHLQALL